MLLGVSGIAGNDLTLPQTRPDRHHPALRPPDRRTLARRGERRGRDAEAEAQSGGGGRNFRASVERRLIGAHGVRTFEKGGGHGKHHDSQFG